MTTQMSDIFFLIDRVIVETDNFNNFDIKYYCYNLLLHIEVD